SKQTNGGAACDCCHVKLSPVALVSRAFPGPGQHGTDGSHCHGGTQRTAWQREYRSCAREGTMAIIVGSGDYRYEQIDNWAKVPSGWSLREVGAVGVDSQDNVYVFNRGEHPMMVFDRDGNFLRAWGEGLFPRAHGLHMARDDSVFLTDDGDHSVRQCTLEGKVLLTLGT